MKKELERTETSITRQYRFTNYYPTGNFSKEYFDKEQNTMFMSSIGVSQWSRKPKRWDTIKIVTDLVSRCHCSDTIEAYINDELVFIRTPENIQAMQHYFLELNGMDKSRADTIEHIKDKLKITK